ncbi:hypothetical protein ACFX2C_003575 [Malus domestica]
MYVGHFSHEYSCCAEAVDKIALKAFTAGLRDCFFKYMINANNWKTYSEVMAQAYNHAFADTRTYQEKPPKTIPYQQMGSKRKDFHPHQSYFSKKSKGHYHDNQGYRHDNARPQVVNTVGQTRVRTSPTPRYETYTSLNATCVAIYSSIAHLILKLMQRQLGYKPTKNTGTFCCYHEHNGHDGEKCITHRDHIEALAHEGKIDRFLLHPSRDNRNQRQMNVIYSISGGTPISESSNRAMKNSERALRPGYQVFHVEDIRGSKY